VKQNVIVKPKNGRGNSEMKHRTNIEPIIRMLSALTETERAAVKAALDKDTWERKILAASQSKGGVSFSFQEIKAMNKMSESVLSDYLNQKVNAKHTLQARRARATA
jgi:hypothetical protein